jgi:DNA-binding MarR family transcriptional regulator
MHTPFDDLSTPVAQRVADALARVSAALKSRSWQEGESLGLTPTQADILTLLARSGDAPIGVSAVAERLQVSRPTASDAVAALVRKDLASKETAEGDRRAVALRLTERGANAAAVIAGWPDFLTRAVASLPVHEQTALLTGLIGTIRALQRHQDIPTQRLCVTCRHFRANVHPDPDTPHHCALVDAPFGERHLRVDCPEHSPAA